MTVREIQIQKQTYKRTHTVTDRGTRTRIKDGESVKERERRKEKGFILHFGISISSNAYGNKMEL